MVCFCLYPFRREIQVNTWFSLILPVSLLCRHFGAFFRGYNNFCREGEGGGPFLLISKHAELLLIGCTAQRGLIIKDDISHIVSKSAKIMMLQT
jgi:hypothetical protein